LNSKTLSLFQARYTISGDGCWIWLGYSNRVPPQLLMRVNGKVSRVNRLSYTHFKGPIPNDYLVTQTCQIKRCVNPAHLKAVTRKEFNRLLGNSVASINHAKTHCPHCPQGHKYVASNTYIGVSGTRSCKICTKESGKRFRAKQRRDRIARGETIEEYLAARRGGRKYYLAVSDRRNMILPKEEKTI